MANEEGPKRDELLGNLRAKLRALFPSGTRTSPARASLYKTESRPFDPLSEIVHLDGDVYVRDGNATRVLKGKDLTGWLKDRLGRSQDRSE